MGLKCEILFSGLPKGTCLCKTTSFDVLIVKIGAGGSSVWRRQNLKKLAESLCWRGRGGCRGRGAKTPYRIVMKFSRGVGVSDVITHAKFCGHRFRGSGGSGSQTCQFSIDFHWLSLLSLTQACDTAQAWLLAPWRVCLQLLEALAQTPVLVPIS